VLRDRAPLAAAIFAFAELLSFYFLLSAFIGLHRADGLAGEYSWGSREAETLQDDSHTTHRPPFSSLAIDNGKMIASFHTSADRQRHTFSFSCI
jgi:hypothetical protein